MIQVEVGVAPKHATSRIIHIRDWRFVPKELYALDMKATIGRELTTDEIDRLHELLLLEVELVQIEQMSILRCLIKVIGWPITVFSECQFPKTKFGFFFL